MSAGSIISFKEKDGTEYLLGALCPGDILGHARNRDDLITEITEDDTHISVSHVWGVMGIPLERVNLGSIRRPNILSITICGVEYATGQPFPGFPYESIISDISQAPEGGRGYIGVRHPRGGLTIAADDVESIVWALPASRQLVREYE